jgi:hypothetical protein
MLKVKCTNNKIALGSQGVERLDEGVGARGGRLAPGRELAAHALVPARQSARWHSALQ